MKLTTGLTRRFVTIMAAALVIAGSAAAQDETTTPIAHETQTASQPSGNSIIKLNGELGTFGELYNMSGHEDNRPSSSGRIYLRSTLTFWDAISANFNLMLSSEGNSARQEINQFDFNPRWRWGEAHAGDFTTEYSPLTLSGIKIRGGAFQIQPGKFRFALVSGYTNRAVETETNSRSYERMVTGGKIGYGAQNGSSFELTLLTARDRIGSLATARQDSTVNTDSLSFDSVQNPSVVTPQENLVVAATTNLLLFNKRVSWKSEISGSAITRDRRSDELEVEEVPKTLAEIFTPRVSTGADYAYISDLSFSLKRVTLNAGYQYIGPGYVSLGVASLLADKRMLSAGMQVRHGKGILKLDGSMQSDNLIDQKLATTSRLRLSSLFSYRLTRGWNMNVGLIFAGMENDASKPAAKIDYRSWIARSSQTITFMRRQGLRGLSFDYTYQQAKDPTPGRQTSQLKSHSGSMGGSIGFGDKMEMTTQIGLMSTEAGGQSPNTTQTYGIGLRRLAMKQRLTVSTNLTVMVQSVNTSIRTALKSSYQLTQSLQMNGEIEATNMRGGAKSSQYDEIAARLLLSRRF